jgi:hypothetical protein
MQQLARSAAGRSVEVGQCKCVGTRNLDEIKVGWHDRKMNYLSTLWRVLPDPAKHVAAATTILSVPGSAWIWAVHVKHKKAEEKIEDALRPHGIFGLTVNELVAVTGLGVRAVEDGLRRIERQGRVFCFGSKGTPTWALSRASAHRSYEIERYRPRWG